MKNNCSLFDRLFKKIGNDIFLYGISFFVFFVVSNTTAMETNTRNSSSEKGLKYVIDSAVSLMSLEGEQLLFIVARTISNELLYQKSSPIDGET